ARCGADPRPRPGPAVVTAAGPPPRSGRRRRHRRRPRRARTAPCPLPGVCPSSLPTLRGTERDRQLLLPLWQTGAMEPSVDNVLDAVGPRLRALRLEKEMTLADMASSTGISVSTLSRLESGGRRPTLELLLPIARAHGLALDDLVEVAAPSDPRVRQRPVTRGGMTMVPLTRRAG